MPNPMYHQVLCSITEDEYRRMAQDHDPQLHHHHPLLFRTTHEDGDPIYEDDLTLVIRDALIKLAADGQAADQLYDKERHDFDATQLPFALKVALLESAAEHWDPPQQVHHHFEPSYWRGSAEDARRLLHGHPELRLIFQQTPQEVAQAWNDRQSLQPSR